MRVRSHTWNWARNNLGKFEVEWIRVAYPFSSRRQPIQKRDGGGNPAGGIPVPFDHTNLSIPGGETREHPVTPRHGERPG